MRRILLAGLAAALTFALYSLLMRISYSLTSVLNVFSLTIVYFAVREGEVFGAVFGMVCGMIQDAFSLGVFGVAGIAKTLTGYLAGTVSRRIDVMSPSRNLIFHSLLFSLELLVWMVLYGLVFGQPVSIGRGLVLFQPFVTALVASALFVFLGRMKFRGRGRL